jgi:hypothetical protein
MILCVFGHSDKRHIIYTMLRMLQFMGRVCFITSNPCYRQLSPDFDDEFEFGDIHVIYDEDISYVESEHDLTSYDFVVCDCLLSMPSTIDLAIIMDHVPFYEEQLDINDIPDIPTFIPKGETSFMNKTQGVQFVPASVMEKDLKLIESELKLLPINNSAHNRYMSAILEKATHIPKAKLLTTLKQKGELV